MNIVDLSYASKKNKKLDKELNLIFKNYQKVFTNLVNKAGVQTKDNLDIWLSLPLSRNTLISHLYYNFCLAIFVKKNIKKNSKVDQIIVDSPELAKILETYLKKIKIKTKINYKKFFLLSKLLKFLTNFIKFFIKKTYQFLISRITKRNTKKNIKDNIILIDTFALPGFYNKDRYFNGLTRYLKKEQIKKIFFLPTITYTSVKNYYSAYKQIRESYNQVIIKEDFLNFSDLFFSLLHSIRIKFFYFKKLNCEGLDFSKLFNSELKNGIGDDMAVEGLLNYRFIKRLKEKKIELDLLIDWWENQAMDKGLNKAVQTYYPNTKIIGYLGYFPREFELQLSPFRLESKLKYTPKTIAVIGNKIKKKINMFNKQQKVITSPAFRYSYLWNKKKKNKRKNKINIFVALPVGVEDSINIIKAISNVLFIKKNNFNVIIKPHPTMDKKILNKHLNEFNNRNYKIILGSINRILNKTDIVISSMSITCLEAIALGIPVIYIKRSIGLSFKSIPEEISKTMWRNCSSKQEIVNAIDFFTKKTLYKSKIQRNIGKKVRKNYFEPVTKKNVLNFLNLD